MPPDKTRRKQARPRERPSSAPDCSPSSGPEQVGVGERAAGGQFASGSSGNPAGRPRGKRNRATLMAQELLDGEGETIMRKAIELAKAGEPFSLKLCIERILPRRANVVELFLPEIRKAADVAEACAAVIEAAAAGRVTLAEAKEFMGLLELQRRSIETHELGMRVELLEAAADPPTREQLEEQLARRLERSRGPEVKG